MLAYFAYGQRHYYKNPIPQNICRNFWEFQAVIEGKIAQTSTESPFATPLPSKATLWLSPPGSHHGWTGEPDTPATVVVFHFPHIPEALSCRLDPCKPSSIEMRDQDCRKIKQLADDVSRYWDNSLPGMTLCYEQAFFTLSLLYYEAVANVGQQSESQRAEKRVHKALVHYKKLISDNPSLEEIAKKVHSSPAHLRRLFHKSYQCSPKKMFDQIRFQRALELINETTLTMNEIAGACGFQDQSAFSRAFKTHFKKSPSQMRLLSPKTDSAPSQLN